MSRTTLLRATTADLRPFTWGGAPLHQRHAQLRSVIRRRLGERHFHLLAEPQQHADARGTDWYSAADGSVRALPDLPPAERAVMHGAIRALLADINRLGQSLDGCATEDSRLAGRMLRLAACGPTDEYLFVVDDQPVIVCWGHDFEGRGIMPAVPVVPEMPADPASPPPPTALEPAPAVEPAQVQAPSPVAVADIVPTADTAKPADKPVGSKRRSRRWPLWLALGLLASLGLLLTFWIEDRRAAPPVPAPEIRSRPADPGDLPMTGAPPPVTKPPQGALACSAAASSGGGEFTRNRHYLGNKPGMVTIRYNMFSQADAMRVYYRGSLVASTNGPVSGEGTLSFKYKPEDGFYTVMVELDGGDDQTEWQYLLRCPQ